MNAENETRAYLCQHWIHSHEEDRANEMVYRPSTFDFPLSRGREELILSQDDVCIFMDIAAADGSDKKTCTLSEDGTGLSIEIDYSQGRIRRLRILRAEAEKLVVAERF